MFTPQSQGVFKRLRHEHYKTGLFLGKNKIFQPFRGAVGWVKRAEIMWVA